MGDDGVLYVEANGRRCRPVRFLRERRAGPAGARCSRNTTWPGAGSCRSRRRRSAFRSRLCAGRARPGQSCPGRRHRSRAAGRGRIGYDDPDEVITFLADLETELTYLPRTWPNRQWIAAARLAETADDSLRWLHVCLRHGFMPEGCVFTERLVQEGDPPAADTRTLLAQPASRDEATELLLRSEAPATTVSITPGRGRRSHSSRHRPAARPPRRQNPPSRLLAARVPPCAPAMTAGQLSDEPSSAIAQRAPVFRRCGNSANSPARSANSCVVVQ